MAYAVGKMRTERDWTRVGEALTRGEKNELDEAKPGMEKRI